MKSIQVKHTQLAPS